MARQLTWLSDAEWAKIEPLLPQGRKGAWRVGLSVILCARP
jgi:transposase